MNGVGDERQGRLPMGGEKQALVKRNNMGENQFQGISLRALEPISFQPSLNRMKVREEKVLSQPEISLVKITAFPQLRFPDTRLLLFLSVLTVVTNLEDMCLGTRSSGFCSLVVLRQPSWFPLLYISMSTWLGNYFEVTVLSFSVTFFKSS